MSSEKNYESLLKDYDQAQAHLARTRVREKAAKKDLKSAEKNDASKTETEIARLELEIAKAKRKARKAGAAIAKIRIKQWIKANAKHEKSYKLVLDEETASVVEEPITASVEEEEEEEVRTKRKYTRRNQAETNEEDATREIQIDTEVEGHAGTFTSIETAAEETTREITIEAPKKERRPRRSSAEVALEKEAAQAALKESGQDFTIVEGIGPAVTKLLHSVGINSFQDLAAADYEMLKGLMKARRNNIADPTTWAQQAQMIIDNDREGLEQLQKELKRAR
jgi:predicted flap endonuclease-1-like 5' DNA nuclease